MHINALTLARPQFCRVHLGVAQKMAGRRQAFQSNPELQRFLLSDVRTTGKKLGVGSYGSVEELEMNELVCAGKRIHEALLERDNDGVTNIERKYLEECQVMAAIRHPNIVQFLGLCFLEGSALPVLVMERLDSNLDELLEGAPGLPLALKRSLLVDVGRGLLYLHTRNPPVVHRDLSARNVLLTSSLVAKISDLGNARIVNLQPGQLARTLTHLPGTMVYMPPEAFHEGHGTVLNWTFSHLVTLPSSLLHRSADELLRTLLVCQCLHNIPARRPTAKDVLQQLQAVKAQIEGPYGQIVKVDMEKVRVLREKEAEIRRLQQQMQQLEEDKRRLQIEVEARNIQLQQKDDQLQQKNEQIQQQYEQIQQNEHLQQLRQSYQQLHSENMQLKEENWSLTADLNAAVAAKLNLHQHVDQLRNDLANQQAAHDREIKDLREQRGALDLELRETREQLGRQAAEHRQYEEQMLADAHENHSRIEHFEEKQKRLQEYYDQRSTENAHLHQQNEQLKLQIQDLQDQVLANKAQNQQSYQQLQSELHSENMQLKEENWSLTANLNAAVAAKLNLHQQVDQLRNDLANQQAAHDREIKDLREQRGALDLELRETREQLGRQAAEHRQYEEQMLADAHENHSRIEHFEEKQKRLQEYYDQRSTENAHLHQQNEQLKLQIQDLQDQVSANKAQNQQSYQQLQSELHSENMQLKEENWSLTADLNATVAAKLNLHQQVDQLRNDLANQQAAHDREIKDLREQRGALDLELRETREQLGRQAAEHRQYEEQMLADAHENHSRIEHFEEKQKRLQEYYDQRSTENAHLHQQNEQLKLQIQDLQDQVSANKAQNQQSYQQLQSELHSENMQLKEENWSLTADLNAAVAAKLNLHQQVDQLRNDLANQQAAHDREIKDLREQRGALDLELRETREQLGRQAAEHRQYEEQMLADAHENHSRIEHFEEKQKRLQEYYDQRSTENARLHQQNEQLKLQIQDLQDQVSANEAQNQQSYKQLQSEVQKLQKEKKELDVALQEYRKECESLMLEYRASAERLCETEADRDKYKNQYETALREHGSYHREIQQLQHENLQSQLQHQETHLWVVRREEIQFMPKELGRGGWAVVKAAKFRGLPVAAKCLHGSIISQYNRHLFVREMNIASRVRHPNLVQFIGATVEGEPIILAELMSTCLRAVLERKALNPVQINSISVDIARALNYLHLMRPDPIIHRDVSSGNILLNPLPNNVWRAKVSDYGSANYLQNLKTSGPGNPIYAAPEASTPEHQSSKMDVFSYGVLLIEMCSRRLPSNVRERETFMHQIQNASMLALIQQCLEYEPQRRPDMGRILEWLDIE